MANLVQGRRSNIDDKSNGITALAALVDLLMVKGCLVTTEARGPDKDRSKNSEPAGMAG